MCMYYLMVHKYAMLIDCYIGNIYRLAICLNHRKKSVAFETIIAQNFMFFFQKGMYLFFVR